MIKIDNKLIGEISVKSKTTERKRLNFNFHLHYSDRIQRFINVIQPESIIEPHLHTKTIEVFIALKGKIEIIEYDNKGYVKETCIIEPNGNVKDVEIKENVHHSLRAMKPDSVVYIVMQGHYDPKEHKTFMKKK